MDRLASEGVLLEDATVQVPQTRPSHASILTGRYPFEHGVRDNFSPPLRSGLPTLATHLKARGYATAAFIGGFPLVAGSGLNRGFDVYDDDLGPGSTLAERRATEVVGRATAWLKKRRSAPFFVWVHLYDPHAPYEAPEPFGGRYAKRPYDGEVAFADAQVGSLLDFLDRRGARDNTLVVVTSDHGEGLGDHGEDDHLMFIYDSTLRVPCLLRLPSILPAGKRVAGQFRSVDIMPTVLELLGQPAVAVTGASRAAALRAGARLPDNESYAESLYGQLHFGFAPLRGLRAEGWKYIDAPRAELYNLREDPAESQNVLDMRGQVAERLKKRLGPLGEGSSAPAVAVPADAGVIERLAALGYVGVGSSRVGTAKGADPKDKIAQVQAYTRDAQKATRLLRAGEIDTALPILERLSRSESVSFDVQYLLGRALLRKRRLAEAANALEEARQLLPQFVEVYADLAEAFRRQGKLREARAVVDRGLALSSDNGRLLEEGGLALQALGETDAARQTLERARTKNPRALRSRLALSAVYRDQGKIAAAVEELRAAVRLDASFVDGWNALGLLLAQSGANADAEAAFRSALEVRPDDSEVLFNLAELLTRTGRSAEAVPVLERVVVLSPDVAEARRALESARAAAGPLPEGSIHLRLIRVHDRPEAERILARIRGGASFEDEARAHSKDPSASRGGDLGVVRLVDLSEPLRSAAAALRPGGLSEIIPSNPDYLLVRRER